MIGSLLKQKLVNLFFPHIRRSYSQSGEDILISDLFQRLQIRNPSYLDVGTNDPIALNNTYRLYRKGSKGVCVEPNPHFCRQIAIKRKKDICLNAGIAFDEQTQANFYLFTGKAHGLSTFSEKEVAFWAQTGTKEIGIHRPESVIRTPMVHINEIMEKYFFPHPNLVSIDVEGLDLQIIQSIDFEKYKPEVFCVETLWFAENNIETKNKNLISYFLDHGYFLYADTYINSIFCRQEAYPNRTS